MPSSLYPFSPSSISLLFVLLLNGFLAGCNFSTSEAVTTTPEGSEEHEQVSEEHEQVNEEHDDLDEEIVLPEGPKGLVLQLTEQHVATFESRAIMPDYEYAGELQPGGLATTFTQATLTGNLWAGNSPDVIVPISLGYASGIDTRVKPLVLRNRGSSMEDGTESFPDLEAIPGLRRSARIELPNDPFKGIIGVAHDTGDNEGADLVIYSQGTEPKSETYRVGTLPSAEHYGRDNAVNAHALAVGDLNGNGRSDFVIGDWGGPDWAFDGTYLLIQQVDGTWTSEQNSFLRRITKEWPLVNPQNDEQNNILIDLHLADINNDGLDDLVVGWGHGSTDSYVFINQGDGQFSEDEKVALPELYFGRDNSLHLVTWSMDLNHDGYKDLVVLTSRFEPFYSGTAIQFFINEGNGTFTDETDERLEHLTGAGPELIANNNRFTWSPRLQFLDVNNDGFDDILFSSQTGNRIWINKGLGYFKEFSLEKNTYHTGDMVAWGDFNGNGKIQSVEYEWRSDLVDPDTGEAVAHRTALNIYELNQVLSTGPEFSEPLDAPGFNELFYLHYYPEVAALVQEGQYVSGLQHFLEIGDNEGKHRSAWELIDELEETLN